MAAVVLSRICIQRRRARSVRPLRKPYGINVILEGYAYDPYGKAIVFKPGTNGVVNFGGDDVIGGATATTLSVWQYTGRRADPESGLLYFRTRYLDTHIGRFISRDTIGVWGDSANLGSAYAMVGNRPMNHEDPLGTRTFHFAILPVKGNDPRDHGKTCADISAAVINGIEAIAKQIPGHRRLWDSVGCDYHDANLGPLADDDAGKAAQEADAWIKDPKRNTNGENFAIAWMQQGSNVGAASGQGASIVEDRNGFCCNWADDMIAEHEIAHMFGAHHYPNVIWGLSDDNFVSNICTGLFPGWL